MYFRIYYKHLIWLALQIFTPLYKHFFKDTILHLRRGNDVITPAWFSETSHPQMETHSFPQEGQVQHSHLTGICTNSLKLVFQDQAQTSVTWIYLEMAKIWLA